MSELTKDEMARLLTQAQVDALPDGEEVMVKWTGGNGPHRYKIAHRNDKTYADLIDGHPVGGDDGRLFPVGTERCHDRVFLPSKNAASEGTSDSPCWPQRIGNMVRVRVNNDVTLSAPLASLHITWGDDGWISVWCNGTGMGQVDKEQAERLEAMMANAEHEPRRGFDW